MLWKMIGRDIRGSFGRFFSMLAIVAIGTGFFSGVRITTPIMKNTFNEYYAENRFFDYRLLSTIGWEDEEVEKFAGADGVTAAEGAWQYDVICQSATGDESVYKVHSITDDLNYIQIKEGRMPENSSECILDNDNRMGLSLGDQIIFSEDNDADTLDAFSQKTYTIVGFADSSLYINFERGTTSVGNGSLLGYLYLPRESFTTDEYTEIYIKLDTDYMIYSDQYNDEMDELRPKWEDLTQGIADDRYNSLYEDAEEELEDARKEFEESKADGEQELQDAANELADAKQELDDAAQELADGKAELEDAATELSDAKSELDDAAAELLEGKEQLDSYEGQLNESATQLAESKAQLDAAAAQLAESKAQLDMMAQIPGATSTAEYQMGMAQYNEGLAQYNAGMVQYNEGFAQYNAGVSAYEQAKAEYDEGVASYNEGLAEYNQAVSDYEQGVEDYNSALAEYNDGLEEYNDGLKKYADGKKEFDEEIADAEQKIKDAEEELESFEAPDTYVLERGTNIGYTCFESDSEIIEQIARVLPLFFILVAVLVCMTTMTRMVDERRGQIGIMKGLGYSRGDIMFTFLAYAGIAAALGCIIGYVGGIFLFPSVIWHAYKMMYIDIPLVFMFDWKLAVAVFVISVAAACGTTFLTCRNELVESAASLMRPKAPKAGKRVFLERIPAIWNRMKFMHKVSARNILRYKKRFFMMIVGISGCMALLLTGFGIKDSISTFVTTQFTEIQVAKAGIVIDATEQNDLPEEMTETMEEVGATCLTYNQGSWDLVKNNKTKSITLITPSDYGDINSFFRLRTMDGEELPEPGPGEAFVSISISKRYNVNVGDTILLRNEDMDTIQAKVSGVFENHVYNYVFISSETLENATGKYEVNGAYVNFPEDSDVYEAQTKLSQCDNVVSVSVYADLEEMISNMMSSLNYVVLVIIISAAALALVVLYNLTNINILERIREIATIKVLGFRKRETSEYVFRENIVLTTIGMAIGIGLGVLLHSFVIDQIAVDLVYFRKQITLLSFVLSVLLTYAFTFLVDRVMSLKLEKINMAESLKSVE